MNILMVSPPSPDTFWNLKHVLKFISKKAALPPLGLLTVAAMLPKDWEKKLVDMTISTLTDQDIKWADLVFISAMAIQKTAAEEVIDRCKKLNATIIAGGPLFSSAPELFSQVDHLILGEAELTLQPFLHNLANGNPKRIYTSDEKPDLSDSPIPLWQLLEMKKYASMSIQYSRGCPFTCDFCDVTRLFGSKMRTKTTEQILTELSSLYARRWRDAVFIVDDNVIANKRKLKQDLLPAMIDWMRDHNHPFPLNTQVSINLADDEELMHLMVQAGFDTVFIGIETPHEKSLAECSKSQNTNRDLIACVRKIQNSGLQVQAGFILGFDSDEAAIFDRLISFIQESGIVTAMVGLLNAPRGTKLYKRLMEENRLLKDSTGDNTDMSMNFIPTMDSKQLIEGYKKVVSTIYSSKYYSKRVLTLLRNYHPTRKSGFNLRLVDLRTLLRSTWRLGIMEKGRFDYWKLIFWSLFARPQLLHLTITFAIYGFHFRRIFSAY